MSSRRVARLASCISAATVVFAAACSKPGVTEPLSTGRLEITVQNSSGVPAAIQVTGPSGFHRAVTASSTISDLVPGTYTITAADVSGSGANWVPSVSPGTVQVSASSTPAHASVTYAPATGLLSVTATGLPAGASGGVAITQSGGFNVTGNVPQVFSLAPGTYQVAAASVQANGATYDGAPSLQSVTITASLTPVSVSITYAQRALAIVSPSPPAGQIGVDYGPSVTKYYSCHWSPVFGWHQTCIPCASYSSCPGLKDLCGALGDPRPCVTARLEFVGFTFKATGGTPPYKWSATGLPAGLSVDSPSGRLLGTPTASGTFGVHVTLADSGTPQLDVAVDYSLVIAP